MLHCEEQINIEIILKENGKGQKQVNVCDRLHTEHISVVMTQYFLLQ